MRLQKLIIPEREKDVELFYRGNLSIKPCNTLSFDTYYNAFCYTKYRKYTIVDKISFSCTFIGKATVQMCFFDGEEHVILEKDCENEASFSVDLSLLAKNGIIYPKIIAVTECCFTSGEFFSDIIPGNISVAVAICTFRREQYVLRNIDILKNYNFSFIDRVFIIDNGNTLNQNTISDNFIKILPNKNYGGSGGFTRGLIEAYDGKFSHVILMDDDVEFFPQTLEQMTVFMALLKNEFSDSWFSAAMFPIDKCWEQYEMGAEWSSASHIYHHKTKIDMRNIRELPDNLCNENVEYGAWWTLCMPLAITNNGLPYPFFIKFDDIEYGVRNNRKSEIITMNGIAVRHEAFDLKSSFILEYYNLRNELVVKALNCHGILSIIKKYWKAVLKNILYYRYDICKLSNRALNDFLRGVDFFLECDEEKLNNEVIKSAPKLIDLEEISSWSELLRNDNCEPSNKLTFKIVLTLNGHLIPWFMLDKKLSAVPLSRISLSDTYRKKEVIQYQLGTNKGILTKRNFNSFCRFLLSAIGNTFKILFRYKRIQRNYVNRKLEMSSFDFWRKHLGIK